VLSACYSKMYIDIDIDLILLHGFTFVISIVVNCKSYAFVIGLLKNILTYLLQGLVVSWHKLKKVKVPIFL